MNKLLVIKVLSNTIMYFVFGLIILLACVMFVPSFLGYDMYSIVSGSMEPTIKTDSIVFTKSVELTELKEKDIITFVLKDKFVTHRVYSIDIETGVIITKGDQNLITDGSIMFDSVKGKVVFTIPNLGKTVTFLKTPIGILALIFTPIIVWWLNYIIQTQVDKDIKEINGFEPLF